MHHFNEIVKKHWGAIIILSLFGAVAALWLSLQQTPQYVSNTRILIAYKKFEGVDGYSALRATEKMGQNLVNIMGTASFLDKVLQSGFSVRDTFPQDEFTRREIWEGMLQAEVIPDTSILDINVLHTDREQAERIVAAVSSVLIANGKDYLGIDNLNIQVVDAPLTSVAPVKPQVPTNVAMGFVIGFILSTGVTLLRELFAASTHTAPSSVKRAEPKLAVKPPVVIAPAAPIKPAHTMPVPIAAIKASAPAPVRPEAPLKPVMPFDLTPHLAASTAGYRQDGDTEGVSPLGSPTGLRPVARYKLNEPVKTSVPPPTLPSAAKPTDIVSLIGNIKTMHDHAKTPFGGAYFFQHKLIQFEETVRN